MKRVLHLLLPTLMGASMAFAPEARAQARTAPIVVVIEAPRSVDADRIRAALRRGGLVVVALTDDAAVTAREVLSVRLTRDTRRAHVQLRSPRGTSVHRLTAPRLDASGRWLVGPMLALVASARAPSAEVDPTDVLDPWGSRGARSEPAPGRAASEVLDPWRGAPVPAVAVATARVVSEVLDPWGNSGSQAVGAGRAQRGPSEVLDPWGDRADLLDAPRP